MMERPEDPQDLLPQVISVGTSRALRVERVGRTYFVKSLSFLRSLSEDGSEILEEQWKTVAVAEGRAARSEAIDWLNNANRQVLAMMEQDRR